MKPQISMIHVACKTLGIDSATRHDLQLLVTGKASLTDMTDRELDQVVNALRARGFKPTGRTRPAAARADVRLCHALWGQLARAGAVKVAGRRGLNAFVRSRFEATWGQVPIDIDVMTDYRQIGDVIEALKAMCRRAGIEGRP